MEKTETSRIAEVEKELRYIAGVIKQRGREILDHYPITAPQFVALQWLVEKGDMTIGELSQCIHLAHSTTTDLVDRMENNQLVERSKDASDKRVVRIHPLDKGKKIIQEVIKQRQTYLKEVLDVFPEEDIDSLNRLLRLLHERMVETEQF